MSVRVQRHPNGVPDDGTEITSAGGDDEVKYTHHDGYTFAWGPGQTRNFLDDGVGAAHGAFDGDENAITENGLEAPNGESRA